MKISDIHAFFNGTRLVFNQSGDFHAMGSKQEPELLRKTDLRTLEDLSREDRVTSCFFQMLVDVFEKADVEWMPHADLIIDKLESLKDPSEELLESVQAMKDLQIVFFSSQGVLTEKTPDFLKNSQRYVRHSAVSDPSSIKFCSLTLLHDPAFACDLVSHNNRVFPHLPTILKRNKAVILTCVSRTLDVFDYIDAALLSDTEFVVNLIERRADVWIKLNEDIKKEEGFLEKALSKQGELLAFLEEEKTKDPHLALIALRDSLSYVFEMIHPTLADSQEFVLEAIKINPLIYKYLKEEFQLNEQIALLALKSDMYIFDELHKSLHKSHDFRLKALKDNPALIERMYDELDPKHLMDYVKAAPLILAPLTNSFEGFPIDADVITHTLALSLSHSSPFADALVTVRSLMIKLEILEILCQIDREELLVSFTQLEKMQAHFTKEQFSKMTLALWLLCSFGFTYKSLNELGLLIKSNYRDLKDFSRMNDLLRFLISAKQSCWSLEAANTLIVGCFRAETFKQESILRFRFATAFLKLKETQEVAPLEVSSKSLSDHVISIVTKKGLIDETIQEPGVKLASTFLSSRLPSALFTYMSLHSNDPVMMSAIKEFTTSVLEGKFEHLRQTRNSHASFLNAYQRDIWPLDYTQELDEGLKLTETGNWEDLFLSGSEVSSCLRVDGLPRLNRCLMGYVLDGKVRLIAVKNPGGKIIARNIWKLFIDANSKPALMIEARTYGQSTYHMIIQKVAIHKAKILDIPLYIADDDGEVELYSKASYAPYEYDDSALGVTNGCYKVMASKLI